MADSEPLLPSKDSPSLVSPPTWHTYVELARLHKFPAGTLVVFWPCAWGLLMAGYAVSMPLKSLTLQTIAFFVGSTIVHSAGCVINDICDRDIDRQIERTKNRPLAAGRISLSNAFIFLLIQIVALVPLVASMNRLGIFVGTTGLASLPTLYPLMKRWTYWPQAWLGLTMGWGFFIAWVSVTNSVDRRVIPAMVFGVICWTIFYDTIYACQDRKGDIKVGVGSTAVLFNMHIKPILSIFASAVLLSFAYAGFANQHGVPFFAVAVGGCALHFAWQLWTLELDSDDDCWAKFKSNNNMGYIVWIGLFIDYGLKVLI